MVKIFRSDDNIVYIGNTAFGFGEDVTVSEAGGLISIYRQLMDEYEVENLSYTRITDELGNTFATPAACVAYLNVVFTDEDLIWVDELDDVAISGDYSDLVNVPTSFPPSAHTHSQLHTPDGSTRVVNVLTTERVDIESDQIHQLLIDTPDRTANSTAGILFRGNNATGTGNDWVSIGNYQQQLILSAGSAYHTSDSCIRIANGGNVTFGAYLPAKDDGTSDYLRNLTVNASGRVMVGALGSAAALDASDVSLTTHTHAQLHDTTGGTVVAETIGTNTFNVNGNFTIVNDFTANGNSIFNDDISVESLADFNSEVYFNDPNIYAPNGDLGLSSTATTSANDQFTISGGLITGFTVGTGGTAPVDSVNGQTGVVVLDTDDIAEGTTNLYYTDARVAASPIVIANTAATMANSNDISVNAGDISDNASDIVTNAGDILTNTTDIANLHPVAVSGDYNSLSNTPTPGTTTLQSLRNSCRIYCYTNNRWVTANAAYGPNYIQWNVNRGTGAAPTVYWNALGELIPAGATLKSLYVRGRCNNAEVTDLEVHVNVYDVDFTAPGTTIDSVAEVGSVTAGSGVLNLLNGGVNSLDMHAAVLSLNDTVITNTAPVIINFRPVGTITATRYYSIDYMLIYEV